MKKLLILLILLSGLFFFSPSTHAQYAECDDCGYCVGREAPGNWDECRKCIYDKTTGAASANQTLEIKPNAKTNILEQITKTPGKYFTQLGCIDTGADSFSNPSAPGGVLNFLLTKLIFPIVGILSFLSLIYGAFLLMTAQGSSEQIGRGKSYIVGAIVGLIFTLSAVLIISIIAGDILKIPGFSNGSVVKLYAAGQPSLVFPDKIVQPIVEVKFDSEVVGQATIKGPDAINQPLIYKDFTILANRKLREGETVTLRFINDHAPDCCGRTGGPLDDGDGDRNFYLRTAEIDNVPCKTFIYDGQTINSGSIVYANQSKPIACNF